MNDCYMIRDWDKRFETAETRKLEHLKWLPKPNKHDGLSFRKLAAQKNPCELYAAWVLILEVASKSHRTERGKLARDGRPLNSSDLQLMTGFPAAIFDRALKFFSDSDIGWLLPPSAAVAADVPASPGSSPAVEKGRKVEKVEKGREGARSRCSPSEAEEFCESLGLPRSDGQAMYLHWEEKGWAKVKDWQQTIRKWKAFGYLPSQKMAGRNGLNGKPRLMSFQEREKRIEQLTTARNDLWKIKDRQGREFTPAEQAKWDALTGEREALKAA